MIPQLMPMYWIMSTFMVILFYLFMINIYGSFNNLFFEMKVDYIYKLHIMWYW